MFGCWGEVVLLQHHTSFNVEGLKPKKHLQVAGDEDKEQEMEEDRAQGLDRAAIDSIQLNVKVV